MLTVVHNDDHLLFGLPDEEVASLQQVTVFEGELEECLSQLTLNLLSGYLQDLCGVFTALGVLHKIDLAEPTLPELLLERVVTDSLLHDLFKLLLRFEIYYIDRSVVIKMSNNSTY